MRMWSLKEGNKKLKPKKFSNGKNQEDIVKETLKAIKEGNKVIFIQGVCGSGKSAIALNIAKELGKTSIIVPIKNLQKQYEQDYMHKKQIFQDDGTKLKISMITGRNNHECPYLKARKSNLPVIQKREVNSNLNDIFKQTPKQSIQEKQITYDESADNKYIPCKIEIKEKNMERLRHYYKENKDRKGNATNLDLKFTKRMAVAPACPYWSPILPNELNTTLSADKQEYKSIKGDQTIYLRQGGCSYYKQFLAYKDSDVLIFNSMQYLLETGLGRKPLTEVEIIDECDEFLDNLAAEGTININRLKSETGFIYTDKEEGQKLIKSLNETIEDLFVEARNHAETEKIMNVSETKVMDLLTLFTKNDYFELVQDEDSYIESTSDLCRKFYELAKETYVTFYKIRDRNEYGIKLVTINLDSSFNSLLDKNKAFVMMSGTLHSERVLKEIFGIKNLKIIEAETINQGNITKQSTGLEKDFKYENFSNGSLTREDYLKAFDKCVEEAKKPTVVHINAFKDLPTDSELFNLDLKNLISSSQLMAQQNEDRDGELVHEFKQGKEKILFTTRCNRGIDFPYETCNSVVISKFPYPNTQSLFWQILKKQKPAYFWDFYKDKAHRELLQKIYRSVRAHDDKVNILSPDIRVLETKIF